MIPAASPALSLMIIAILLDFLVRLVHEDFRKTEDRHQLVVELVGYAPDEGVEQALLLLAYRVKLQRALLRDVIEEEADLARLADPSRRDVKKPRASARDIEREFLGQGPRGLR